MNSGGHNRVDENRAAVLLGMPSEEIRRLSRLSGLGQVEKSERKEKLTFTYEELRKICLLAMPATE
jgi:hypothetical protein